MNSRSRTTLGILLGLGLASAGLVQPSKRAALAGVETARVSRNSSNNPVPFINQPLSPSVAAPGGTGFILAVNGTGFVGGAVVDWNGSPRATTFSSSSELTATILSTDIATAGTASVTVVNPAPGGGRSNVRFFEVVTSETSVVLGRADSAVGNAPAFVVAADFNGDGKMDLAATNDADDTVSVLIGNGDGTFKTPTTNATGVDPLGIVAADFNNDGKLDLAVVNDNCSAPPCQAGSVSILLGNGDGTFQAQTQFSVGTGPVDVAVADFNGDGNLDLAVTNEIDNTVSILLGNGNGTFAPAVAYSTDFGPISVAAGDFNGDGKLDLAVTNSIDGTLTILLGNGDGTFQPGVDLAAGSEPFGLVVADFNGDGKLDIAVTDADADTIAVLLGNGNGTFAAPVQYAASGGPLGLTAGDFNGDGKLDLATAVHSSNAASILLGNGDGTFQAATEYTTGANPFYPAAGDFNNDGRLDLAVADQGGGAVSVLLQTGSQPAVSFSPASLTFTGQLVGTTSPPQVITLTNTGAATLTITSISITGADPTDFAETNTCGTSVAVGANCAITVTFTPTAAGTRTASVSVSDNAPGSPQTVALSGTGTAPAVTLSPTSLTFAGQLVGTTSPPQAITLTNTGTATLTITSISITGADPTDFAETNTCGSNVAAGANCAITVTFTPKASGKRTASVSVSDNAPKSPQKAPLTGTGTAPAVTLSPTSLTFAGQLVGTTSPPQAITLTNTGTATLTITSISITGADSTDFAQTNTCGSSVAVGANCAITVTFTPKASGKRTASVSVSDNAPKSPQKAALTGTGTAPAVTLSPTSLTFGNQALETTSPPQAITLTNTGTATLTITSITITGANSADFAQTNTCGSNVAAGANCSIMVTFTPTAIAKRTASVSVSDNAPKSPQKAPLTGTGTEISLSPASLNFGNQTTGTTSAPQNITVTNVSKTATVTITSISIGGTNASSFAETNTCGTSLAPLAVCTISVTFTPQAKGAASAVVNVVDNGGGSPQTASLAGTGT